MGEREREGGRCLMILLRRSSTLHLNCHDNVLQVSLMSYNWGKSYKDFYTYGHIYNLVPWYVIAKYSHFLPFGTRSLLDL